MIRTTNKIINDCFQYIYSIHYSELNVYLLDSMSIFNNVCSNSKEI